MGKNIRGLGPLVGPPRIRIRRRVGWSLPDGYVWIVRPTRWFNPIRIDKTSDRRKAIQEFRRLLLEGRLPIIVEYIRCEIGKRGCGIARYCR